MTDDELRAVLSQLSRDELQYAVHAALFLRSCVDEAQLRARSEIANKTRGEQNKEMNSILQRLTAPDALRVLDRAG